MNYAFWLFWLSLFSLFVLLTLFTRVEAARIASGIPSRKIGVKNYAKALTIVLGHTVLIFFLIPFAVGGWLREKWENRRR